MLYCLVCSYNFLDASLGNLAIVSPFQSSCNIHMILRLCSFITNQPFTTCTCIDKSMQNVLELGSIDNSLTFDIDLIQLIFHTNTYACKVFSIQIFQYFSAKLPRGFALTCMCFSFCVLLNSS